MQKTPFYKRFAGSFVLAVCLLQSASYVDAAQDLNEVRKMAEQGDAEAQFTLGQMYDSGDGVAQNYKQAAAWYRKAAEQGNASAQYFLGGSYALGEGVTMDKQEAALWFRKAAEQGDADAQYALGRIYNTGSGVAKDLSESYAWYSVAATNGSKDALERRESTAQKLSQAELDAAQELAGVYLQKYPKRK